MAALLLAPLATTPSYRCVQQGDGSCATPTFEVESGEVHMRSHCEQDRQPTVSRVMDVAKQMARAHRCASVSHASMSLASG